LKLFYDGYFETLPRTLGWIPIAIESAPANCLMARVSVKCGAAKRVACRTAAMVSEAAPRAKEPELKKRTLSRQAQAAVLEAEREGLTLLACPTMVSGYHGVLRDSMTAGLVNPFRAQVRRGGVRVTLGRFGTAEEAALCYARSPEGMKLRAEMLAAVERDLSMSPSATEAREQARQEGLSLPLARNPSGFKNVAFDGVSYRPWVTRDGKQVYLGSFRCAEAAALAYARLPEGRAAAARRVSTTANRSQPVGGCERKLIKKKQKSCALAKARAHGTGRRSPNDAGSGGASAGLTVHGATAPKPPAKAVYPSVRMVGPRPPPTPTPGRRAAARALAAEAVSPEPAAVGDWATVGEMVWWLVDALSPSKVDQSA
jgi:hypothetical protein